MDVLQGGEGWTEPGQAGCESCWLLAHNVQVICFAALESTAAKCPNTGNPGDLQRASDCFKNTLFFRKYSVQYSVLCSPQLQPPDSAEAKATSARSPPQLESRGQVSPTPFPSSQGGRWLSSPRWYPAARCSPPTSPVHPKSQCQVRTMEPTMALGGWGHPRGHTGAVMLPHTRIWGSPCDYRDTGLPQTRAPAENLGDKVMVGAGERGVGDQGSEPRSSHPEQGQGWVRAVTAPSEGENRTGAVQKGDANITQRQSDLSPGPG